MERISFPPSGMICAVRENTIDDIDLVKLSLDESEITLNSHNEHKCHCNVDKWRERVAKEKEVGEILFRQYKNRKARQKCKNQELSKGGSCLDPTEEETRSECCYQRIMGEVSSSSSYVDTMFYRKVKITPISDDVRDLERALSQLTIENFLQLVEIHWKKAFVADGWCKVAESGTDLSHCSLYSLEENHKYSDSLACSINENLHKYLNFLDEWNNGDSRPFQEELGFIVTKLLKSYCGIPMPPQKALLPNFFKAFCIHGVSDKYYDDIFRPYLKENGVLFLTPKDLENFCISEYRKVSSSLDSSLDSLLTELQDLEEEDATDFYDISPTVSVRTFLNGPSFYVSYFNLVGDTKFKNHGNGDSKHSIKSNASSQFHEEVEEEELPFFVDKGTQTSEHQKSKHQKSEHQKSEHQKSEHQRSEQLEEKITILSTAAEIGRSMRQEQREGKEISSQLIVKALLDKLSRSEGHRAWVLVNFPNSCQALSELESNLQGRFVPDITQTFDIRSECRSKLLPFIVNTEKPFTPITSLISIESNEGIHNAQTDDMQRLRDFYRCNGHFKSFSHSGDTVRKVLKFIFRNIQKEEDLYMMDTTSDDELFKLEDPIAWKNLNYSMLKAGLEDDTNRSIFERRSSCDFQIYTEKYNFLEFYAPPGILKNMGEMWYGMEKEYTEKLKNTFSRKQKSHVSSLLSSNHTEKILADFLSLADNKQELVNTFQEDFNSLKKKERFSLEIKQILYDKVFDLQMKLWDISDYRQFQREKLAKKVAKAGWVTQYVTDMCETQLSLLDIEIDRFQHTMQTLEDYYRLYLRKVPRVEKTIHIKRNKVDLECLNPALKQARKYFQFRKSKGFCMFFNPLFEQVNLLFHACASEVEECTVDRVMRKHLKSLPEQAIHELTVAVKNEKKRIQIRIRAIQRNLLQELSEFKTWWYAVLCNWYKYTREMYEKEIIAVNALGNLVNMAIEVETSFDHQIILTGDTFTMWIESSKCSYGEIYSRRYSALSPEHIENLICVFEDFWPSGFIQTKSFLLLLDDLIFAEGRNMNCLPESWQNLKLKDLKRILEVVYGPDTHCNDWREFLIIALDIALPNVSELMRMACEFRCAAKKRSPTISVADLNAARIWLENENCSAKQGEITKRILKTFRAVDEVERLNYKEMLLFFCKDLDPLKGFAKALCLSTFFRQTDQLYASDEECVLTCPTEDLNQSQVWSLDQDENLIDFQETQLTLGITYEDFESSLSLCFQGESNFPRCVCEILKGFEATWIKPYSLCKILGMLRSEPELLEIVQAAHKFKACVLSDVIDHYLFYQPEFKKNSQRKKLKPFGATIPDESAVNRKETVSGCSESGEKGYF